jgi:hypothetical protein
MVKKYMSQIIDENHIIPEIEFPQSLRTILSSIIPKMVDAIRRDGIDPETGKIPLPIGFETLEKKEFIAFVIFEWMADTIEIIGNLNMILGDINPLNSSRG